MPNGPYEPQCHSCEFFNSRPNRRNCSKHDFVFPEIGSEVICRDYQIESSLGKDENLYGYILKLMASDWFRSMARGLLYCWGEVLQPLDRFSALQNLIVEVTINEDPEFGWSIYIHEFKREFFPTPRTSLTVDLDGELHEAMIVDAKRLRIAFVHRTLFGRWKRGTRLEQRMIRLTDSHQPLYDWVDRHYRMETLFREYEGEFSPELKDWGAFALVEIKPDHIMRVRESPTHHREREGDGGG